MTQQSIITNLTLVHRKNRDESITFAARWTATTSGVVSYGCRKLAKTGPRPTAAERSAIWRQAKATMVTIYEELGVNRQQPFREQVFGRSPRDVIDSYLMWSEATEVRGTTENKQQVCAAFLCYLADAWPDVKEFNGLSVRHVTGYRDWRLAQPKRDGSARSPNTVRHELGVLRSLWDYAYKHEFAARNEAARARGPAGVPAVAHVPDTVTVLAAIEGGVNNPIRRAAVYLLAATGMQQGELRRLMALDYDMQARLLRIPEPAGQRTRRTKRKDRTIPLGEGAIQVLGALPYIKTGPLLATAKGRALSSQINAWLRPYNISPHDLRRWFCSQLQEMGYPQYVIDTFMGHATKSAVIYRPNCDVGVLREAIERIDAVLIAPCLKASHLQLSSSGGGEGA